MKAVKPPKQSNPTGRPLPSRAARDFYSARRLKEIRGRISSVQNHMTGSVITDFYGHTYHVLPGGALKSNE